MFTGIIEELGTVQKLDAFKDSARLTVEARKILQGSQIGDSIAVNGVCLTVTEMSGSTFSVDIMYETLRKTNLKDLTKLTKVNLERALQLQTRLGGHLVSGHVDGIGAIVSIEKIASPTSMRLAQQKKSRASSCPKVPSLSTGVP